MGIVGHVDIHAAVACIKSALLRHLRIVHPRFALAEVHRAAPRKVVPFSLIDVNALLATLPIK
ncbi:hypothetical protein RYD26_12400 [Pasteurellaceae bacterium LIM206]|nr:hypothetical protein [Pasteurellaceae bacterium LIM206]